MQATLRHKIFCLILLITLAFSCFTPLTAFGTKVFYTYDEVGNMILKSGDNDNDGFSNADELNYGTDPNNSDTDADGVPDGWEVVNGLDPLSNDANYDPDNDGVSNFDEYIAGTNPGNNDTDGDGMPDGWEVANGLNPLYNEANDDPDSDGVSNFDEYIAGTNPNIPNMPYDLVLANETVSTGTMNYQAENSIIAGSAYIIESGSVITLQAGNIISLVPGFSANGGSDFTATIE